MLFTPSPTALLLLSSPKIAYFTLFLRELLEDGGIDKDSLVLGAMLVVAILMVIFIAISIGMRRDVNEWEKKHNEELKKKNGG